MHSAIQRDGHFTPIVGNQRTTVGENPRSNTPGGHKGMGEGGAIGAPPAVFNAVADALALVGARVTRQPLGPPQVLALIPQP